MSENRANYTTNAEGGTTLQELSSRNCARRITDPLYCPPTPEEVAALIQAAGWSQNDTAKIVGVAYSRDKGSKTVRRWKAPAGSNHALEIPYAVWRLMLLESGAVKMEVNQEPLQQAG